ncbi:VOC family protein [Lysinibacillus capsici]|uniref:VOC family protein n=1 Tax=Lysinibacillus TaxID=400634 RepID=UPI0022B9BB2F|nr:MULTISPECIES: VOC family protein [Lysinibacillus]MED3876963.1 VOC family protein [Lysinibacillus capsici]WBF58238.1 VOC family protein [Lysinibacillus sp. JK80]WPK05286.1 VOC family protein [Lysinibacillus capsici]
MKIRKIDHVGIIVNDLPAAKAFFLDFGLEVLGEGKVEGEWVKRMERVIGLQDIKEDVAKLRTSDSDANIEIVMLRTPDGETNIELVKFNAPSNEIGIQHPLANTLGIQHIAFNVEDIEALVNKLTKKGAELISDIYSYENAYKLCYVRGPEGIILELAEEIK